MQLGPIQNRVIANLLFLSFRINNLDSNIVYLSRNLRRDDE